MIFIRELYAGEKNNYGIIISPGFSFLYGTIYEYVFIDGRKGSELRWDLKPLVMAGSEIAFNYSNFYIKESLLFAINDHTGRVKDYDWDDSGDLSHFSSHSVSQNGAFFFNIILSYLLSMNGNFFFVPGMGFRLSKIQLTAENGYLEYPPGSEPVNTYGKGIIYEQRYLLPYAGGLLRYYGDMFVMSTGLYFSNFLYCNARDNHIKRDIDFYDRIKMGKYYNIYNSVEYLFSDRISLSLLLTYTYIPLKKGDSYYINLSDGVKSSTFKDAAGIKAEFIELMLLISLLF
ncbi:MAG TPA: omptin family outer membrane protease [Spirochaetota bacterium]|nr:omptin family outer membrane protease [Spirochaetota bacterium]HPD78493.1 omptin family outer membrane protease [Spirochaetota bacterium]HRS63587.1 omptin family outer membrane protease [Spirochaetota bacterium]HRU64408.1 omptin family outer membrane protease [Spirochaetota bacterium]